MPPALQSLWLYHRAIYEFHVGLTSGHGYASPAWQWPLLLRPTSMYYGSIAQGEAGCTAPNGCVENIYSMPNPLIWYAGVAAVLYLVYRFVVTRDWRFALVLTGVGVTYVPWLLYPERTVFQFYTIAILPFMLLALTFALQRHRRGPARRRLSTAERAADGARVPAGRPRAVGVLVPDPHGDLGAVRLLAGAQLDAGLDLALSDPLSAVNGLRYFDQLGNFVNNLFT